MDLNKFTQKSLEAIQESQNIATKNGNPQLEEIHIHYGLINQQDGLIPRVISYMGINAPLIKNDIEREIDNFLNKQAEALSIQCSYTKILFQREEAKRFEMNMWS